MALLREATLQRSGKIPTGVTEDEVPARVRLTDTPRRKPSMMVAGGLLVAVAAIIGAWLFASVSSTVSIMVLTHDVEAGDVLVAADLRVIEGGNLVGARAIQPGQQNLIVGQAALGPMPAGTVVSTGLFTDRSMVVPAGMAVVGADLEAGAAPPGALIPGDSIALLAANQASVVSESTGDAVVIATGTIWAIESTDGAYAGGQVIAVLVPIADQGVVAQAASDGLLRITLVGGTES